MFACFRIGGIAQAKRDIGTRVFGGVGGCWHQLAYIEPFFGCQMHDLLALRFVLIQIARRDGVIQCFIQRIRHAIGFNADQVCRTLAACEQSDQHTRIGMILDVVEDHGRAGLGGALDRSA